MRRELAVVMAGVAILVTGIPGCSSNKSTTASSETSGAGSTSAAPSSTSAAPAATSSSITLNGVNIPPNGPVRCGIDPQGEIAIEAGHDASSAYVTMRQSSLEVTKVRITDTSDADYDYEPYAAQSGRSRGDARVTKTGDPHSYNGSYKITGHIPGGNVSNAPLEPFEIDVSCT